SKEAEKSRKFDPLTCVPPISGPVRGHRTIALLGADNPVPLMCWECGKGLSDKRYRFCSIEGDRSAIPPGGVGHGNDKYRRKRPLRAPPGRPIKPGYNGIRRWATYIMVVVLACHPQGIEQRVQRSTMARGHQVLAGYVDPCKVDPMCPLEQLSP